MIIHKRRNVDAFGYRPQDLARDEEYVRYDVTAADRAWRLLDHNAMENVQTKAFVCGKRSYLSLLVYGLAPNLSEYRQDQTHVIIGSGADPMFDGVPVYYDSRQYEDNISAVTGMERIT